MKYKPRYCEVCGNEIPSRTMVGGKRRCISNRKVCLKCKPLHLTNYSKGRNRNKHRVTQNARRAKFKTRMIEEKGGGCQICKERDPVVLQFHHTQGKDVGMNWASKYGTPWEEVMAELDKCTLVCSNCHHEIHAGIMVAKEV